MAVLLIEDDPDLSKNIFDALKAEGIVVHPVYDGLLAERTLRTGKYECVILDINLPGMHGFDLCKRFRSYNEHTPVLILTAFSELEDKINGYQSGADDYMVKPFFMRELVLKVQALIKRNMASSAQPAIRVVADLVVDTIKKKVTRQKKEILLTPREFQVLLSLVEAQGDIVSKTDLVKKIWGGNTLLHTNTIEVYVNFLRNKIDKPFGSNLIKTKVGFGYFIEL